jgi:hypothetical protein
MQIIYIISKPSLWTQFHILVQAGEKILVNDIANISHFKQLIIIMGKVKFTRS